MDWCQLPHVLHLIQTGGLHRDHHIRLTRAHLLGSGPRLSFPARAFSLSSGTVERFIELLVEIAVTHIVLSLALRISDYPATNLTQLSLIWAKSAAYGGLIVVNGIFLQTISDDWKSSHLGSI